MCVDYYFIRNGCSYYDGLEREVMRSKYFTNKHYLTKDSKRIAHVHIVDGTYTVCGHYRRFTEFKRRTFDKAAFEQFCSDRNIVMEE